DGVLVQLARVVELERRGHVDQPLFQGGAGLALERDQRSLIVLRPARHWLQPCCVDDRDPGDADASSAALGQAELTAGDERLTVGYLAGNRAPLVLEPDARAERKGAVGGREAPPVELLPARGDFVRLALAGVHAVLH